MIEIVFDSLTKRCMENLRQKTDKINDIYCFGMDENLGPIAGNWTDNRFVYLTKMHNAWELMYERLHDYYEYMYTPFRQRIDKAEADTVKVMELLEKGEDMRIWMGNMPHAICALAYLCYTARKSASKMYIVYCPVEPAFNKHGITSWANLNIDQRMPYADCMDEFSLDDRCTYGDLWQILKEENSNLRIIKNGSLISVPDDYFDPMIKEIMDKGYKSATELLGNLENQLPEYIPHDWLYYRIDVLEKGVDNIPRMPYDVYEAHELCSNNREALSKAEKCGCFYCERIFDPKEIYEYIPNSNDAFCPHCGIDSVIPENDKYPVTPEFIKLMREYWFEDRQEWHI